MKNIVALREKADKIKFLCLKSTWARRKHLIFLGTGEQANLFQGNKGTGTPLGGPLIWPSVYNERLAITHQHRVNHIEAADSITVSTVCYVLSRRKIELRDSPRLSLVVSDFVQLDSISVRKSERRAGFLYKYLYIVIPSHVEVIYIKTIYCCRSR